MIDVGIYSDDDIIEFINIFKRFNKNEEVVETLIKKGQFSLFLKYEKDDNY
jgi:hypothetical protein